MSEIELAIEYFKRRIYETDIIIQGLKQPVDDNYYFFQSKKYCELAIQTLKEKQEREVEI